MKTTMVTWRLHVVVVARLSMRLLFRMLMNHILDYVRVHHRHWHCYYCCCNCYRYEFVLKVLAFPIFVPAWYHRDDPVKWEQCVKIIQIKLHRHASYSSGEYFRYWAILFISILNYKMYIHTVIIIIHKCERSGKSLIIFQRIKMERACIIQKPKCIWTIFWCSAFSFNVVLMVKVFFWCGGKYKSW